MKPIEFRLEKELKNILLNNPKVINNLNVEEVLKELKKYISDIYNGNIDKIKLAENYLNPTIVLIGKLEKYHKLLRENNIGKYILQLDFSKGIDFIEFMDFYNFIDIDDGIGLEVGNTTSLFNNIKKSKNVEGVYLIHQELYEHEDDTDYSLYYIMLK